MNTNPQPFTNTLFYLERGSNTSYRRHVALQLAALVAAQHQFAAISELRKFCSVPDNLSPWLPSREDRINLAAELSSCL